jgi:hypothetical protein
VLDAYLRYLDGAIYNIGNGLVYTLHLVAKYKGILRALLSAEVVEHRRALNLLYGDNFIPIGT